MRANRLREKLDAGLPTLGTHILSCWPTLVELIGAAGGHYDYVEFTAEYAPFTMHDLDNLGRALELAGIGGMIKVEQGEYTHQSMRAIGSGFQSVLFADIRSVDAFKQALLAAHTIAVSKSGLSGAHFMQTIEKLGITNEIRPKLKLMEGSGRTADFLAHGEADIAAGRTSTGDTSTLEDYSVLAKLREEEE